MASDGWEKCNKGDQREKGKSGWGPQEPPGWAEVSRVGRTCLGPRRGTGSRQRHSRRTYMHTPGHWGRRAQGGTGIEDEGDAREKRMQKCVCECVCVCAGVNGGSSVLNAVGGEASGGLTRRSDLQFEKTSHLLLTGPGMGGGWGTNPATFPHPHCQDLKSRPTSALCLWPPWAHPLQRQGVLSQIEL